MNDIMRAPEGFHYFGNFLSEREIQNWVSWVEHLPFVHQVARGQTMKRGYAMFGYEYVTAGRKLKSAEPLPAVLEGLTAKIVDVCPSGTTFDQCIVTKYPVGAGIGWHTDAPSFRDCIAGLSLDTEAEFQFRAKDGAAPSHKLRLTAGSLYVMTGPARWDFEHSVKAAKGTRYSLTFRGVDRASWRRPPVFSSRSV